MQPPSGLLGNYRRMESQLNAFLDSKKRMKLLRGDDHATPPPGGD